MHVRYTYASSKIIEKNTRRKRGCRCSAVAPPPPPAVAAAFHRHFLLPPAPGVCVESICNSLSLFRVATLHATFSTQANSSGNRKFEIEAPPLAEPTLVPLSPASPLIIGGAPGPGTRPGGASSNSGNRMIPRTARSLSRQSATLAPFSIFFPLFFFLQATRKVCSARHREMINPTKRSLHGK